jgi:molecular chaperone Hsp33
VRGAAGRGSIVGDSHPDGSARGLVQLTAGQTEFALGDGSLMQMMRTLHDGRLQQGIVQLPDGAGISSGLMQYMETSEQVTCVICVATLVDEDQILAAGGYIVQLLPEAHQGPLMLMTERLNDFPAIETLIGASDFSPRQLADEILFGMPFTPTEETEVRFDCNCSQVRVVAGLSTLQSSVIQGLIDEGGLLDISCDFCGKSYQVAPEQLRGLLKSN